jgi:hypothetical protein
MQFNFCSRGRQMKAQEILGQCILFVGSALLATGGISSVCAQNMPRLTGQQLQEPTATAKAVSVSAPQPMATGASATVQPAVAAAQPAGAAPVRQPETPASTESETGIRVGDVTHALLQAQVDGRVAGPRLPMLGVTADASWQRYLDSFKHPLPEYFENKISKSGSN